MKNIMIFSILFVASLSSYGQSGYNTVSIDGIVETSVELGWECTGSLADQDILDAKLRYEAQELCVDKLAVVSPMTETYTCDKEEYSGSAKYRCVPVF